MIPRLSPLLFAVLLVGCSSRATRIDSSLAALVPPDSLALAEIRLDQLRATPLYRQLDESNLLPGSKQFRADIDEWLLASDGSHTLILARGRFAGRPPGAGLALIGNTIAVAGGDPMVRAAIAQSKRRTDPPALVARLRALPGQGQIYAVSNGWTGFPEDQARQMGNAANVNRVLRSVQTASLVADLRAGLHLTAAGDCPTEQEAQSLSESLHGLLAVARLSIPPRQPDLLRALDAIHVRPAGRSVNLTLDLPPHLAAQLIHGIAGR